MTPRLRTLVGGALAALLSAACGISTDDSPRNIPAVDQQRLGVTADRSAGAATGTARVYLLAPESAGQSQALQAVARDVDETAIDLLTALFAGPNVVELDSQFRTALPAGVQLLSTTRRGGVLRVDVSKELGQLSGEVLVAAVAQIVFTASEVDGVESVNILINGADQQWPSGNGELQSAPLTVYDYPGLVQSSQPAYPAIPTPVQP
ncbi:MAG: GerMN domain-containing protein, partial [Actinobacteria bacterium]|nr:GerMN domain-containing protein [Actinomycetota bacterium]